jgi:hypothetical protein
MGFTTEFRKCLDRLLAISLRPLEITRALGARAVSLKESFVDKVDRAIYGGKWAQVDAGSPVEPNLVEA